MKKTIVLLGVFALIASPTVFGQENTPETKPQVKLEKKTATNKEVKAVQNVKEEAPAQKLKAVKVVRKEALPVKEVSEQEEN